LTHAVLQELDVLSVVTDWVAVDMEQRSQHLPRLMQLVQLGALHDDPALPSCLSTSPEGRHMMLMIRSRRGTGAGLAEGCSSSGGASPSSCRAADAPARAFGGFAAAGSPSSSHGSTPGALAASGGAKPAAAGPLLGGRGDAGKLRDQGLEAERVGWTEAAPVQRRRGYKPSRLMIAGEVVGV
jgi:hypothetical protein